MISFYLSFKYETIETHAFAFWTLIISATSQLVAMFLFDHAHNAHIQKSNQSSVNEAQDQGEIQNSEVKQFEACLLLQIWTEPWLANAVASLCCCQPYLDLKNHKSNSSRIFIKKAL